jgi:hypothetical protein
MPVLITPDMNNFAASDRGATLLKLFEEVGNDAAAHSGSLT